MILFFMIILIVAVPCSGGEVLLFEARYNQVLYTPNPFLEEEHPASLDIFSQVNDVQSSRGVLPSNVSEILRASVKLDLKIPDPFAPVTYFIIHENESGKKYGVMNFDDESGTYFICELTRIAEDVFVPRSIFVVTDDEKLRFFFVKKT